MKILDTASLNHLINLVTEEDCNKFGYRYNSQSNVPSLHLNSVNIRFEYGEMNITKLNQKIDNIEDEIYREKLKIKKCADQLGETFDDMLANY